jgi:hypothetical protein
MTSICRKTPLVQRVLKPPREASLLQLQQFLEVLFTGRSYAGSLSHQAIALPTARGDRRLGNDMYFVMRIYYVRASTRHLGSQLLINAPS